MNSEFFDLLNAAKYAVAGLPRGIAVLTPEAPGEIEVVVQKLQNAINAAEKLKPQAHLEIAGGTAAAPTMPFMQ